MMMMMRELMVIYGRSMHSSSTRALFLIPFTFVRKFVRKCGHRYGVAAVSLHAPVELTYGQKDRKFPLSIITAASET